ncbi:hypothetical protein NDU88_006380 [Pleurodeles waltl]|uniref:Uncharacterized protein n=1 Tax=Pleurodeles waltl TaxID=8319 RepID=A0AAV7WCD2_PLEWA|nr:hypothetical protein NDU88_006380 [Pleurodeles waltl]
MHSLFCGEKFTAHRSRKTPLDATPAVRLEVQHTGSHGQHRPTSRGEIDATPAVRKKIPCTASRNEAQPDNKPKNPRTDPGTSGNPAIHRRSQSACQKMTHVFPE